MTWPKGTKVSFTVDGEVQKDGNVKIGCQSFSQETVQEVGYSMQVREPVFPWQEGDVVLHVSGANKELRRRGAEGTWDGPTGTTSDSYIDACLRNGEPIYKVLIRGGKIVHDPVKLELPW